MQEENKNQEEKQTKTKQKDSMQGPMDLVEKSIPIYKERFRVFVAMIVISILSYLPLLIISLLYGWLKVGAESSSVGLNITFSILSLASLAVLIYVAVRAEVGMYLAIKHRDKDYKQIFATSKKYFWIYIGLSLAVAILVLLWSILLIIPGIIMAFYYSLASYFLLFEDKKIGESIKASKKLIKGYWWPVVGRLLFVSLLITLVSLVLTFPMMFFAEESFLYTVWSIIANVALALIAPIAIIYMYLMYKNLKEIKGSGDEQEFQKGTEEVREETESLK